MATVTVTIETDNAAFEDPGELPRILAALAARLPAWEMNAGDFDAEPIRDSNGNTVGRVTVQA